MTTPLFDTAKNALAIEAESLEATMHCLDEAQFARAVELIAKAERVGTSGCGHSGIACTHLAHLLCCVEKPARFIAPSDALHGGMGFVKAGDVMVLASRGGKTEELLPILRICREKGVYVVAVTEVPGSRIAQGADAVLRIHVTRECDKFNAQGTTSFVVMAAVFDALQAAVMDKTGFQNEQFALIHPGGAVGKRLNHQTEASQKIIME